MLSALPLANIRPSGLKATDKTRYECPLRVATRVGFCQEIWAAGLGDVVVGGGVN